MGNITKEEHALAEQEFFKNLRSSTAPAHQALETLPLSLSLMSPQVTKKQYENYLVSMREVIRFSEDVVFPKIETIVPDITERRKLKGMDADLKVLGHHTDSITPFSFSYTIDQDVALGFTYVIEGSTLGGRVILKHLESTGILNGASSRFFEGYREKTGTQWKGFMSVLAAYAIENNAQSGIIDGANKTFSAIHDYFKSLQPAG